MMGLFFENTGKKLKVSYFRKDGPLWMVDTTKIVLLVSELQDLFLKIFFHQVSQIFNQKIVFIVENRFYQYLEV